MTNKLIFSTLLMFIFAASNLSAQKLGLRAEYGVQGIAQQSTYLISANRSVDFKLSTVSVSPSRSIGLYTQFNYGWLFFQPEFLYTTYEQTVAVESFSEEAVHNGEINYRESFQQFDIPVYSGVKYKALKIGVGPVFHIGENINTDLTQFENLEIRPSKISAGIQAGIGLDLKYFNIDLKYQRDFNQSTDHIVFNNGNRHLNASISSFRLGVAFALGKNK